MTYEKLSGTRWFERVSWRFGRLSRDTKSMEVFNWSKELSRVFKLVDLQNMDDKVKAKPDCCLFGVKWEHGREALSLNNVQVSL